MKTIQSMNTDKQLPVIERNFHIMNDDRFIMEKLSLPVEIQDGEDIHAAINRTRETIVQNFKAAYPKVYTHLNFDEVIQVRDEQKNKFLDMRTHLPETAAALDKKFENIVSEYAEETNHHPTIEEPIDNSFNLIEIIDKADTVKKLKENQYIIKTLQEKKAYDKKLKELESKLQTT